MASLSYAFVLVVLTLIVASLAHESNQFQGEAKCIIVTSVGSIALMVAWILVYVIAPREFDRPAVCIGKTTMYFDFLLLVVLVVAVEDIEIWLGSVADPRGAEGAMPPPGPVKISHNKDSYRIWLHRFHVSRPLPLYSAAESATAGAKEHEIYKLFIID